MQPPAGSSIDQSPDARRPPEPADVAEADTLPALTPDAAEFVADTDTLPMMCACSASSDQPY